MPADEIEQRVTEAVSLKGFEYRRIHQPPGALAIARKPVTHSRFVDERKCLDPRFVSDMQTLSCSS